MPKAILVCWRHPYQQRQHGFVRGEELLTLTSPHLAIRNRHLTSKTWPCRSFFFSFFLGPPEPHNNISNDSEHSKIVDR